MSIYLDHNATTPLLPEAAEAMARAQELGFANPASLHAPGRKARQLLEDAREGIAAILGVEMQSAQPDKLLFTSGGTEANNLAIFGLAGEAAASNSAAAPRAVVSQLEHPSVLEPAKQLERRGWRIDGPRVLPCGQVDVEHLEALLSSQDSPDNAPPRFVSVMLGNNETGVLQPIERIAPLCQRAGLPLHVDAVQVVGKLPVHFGRLGAAAMTAAAHKFHGPRGIGALVLRHGVKLAPQLFGGFQQEALRPGTESVALAAGMHAALAAWQRDREQRHAHLAVLGLRFEEHLRAAWPECVIHGANAPRLPHTCCVSFPGLNRQSLMMALDLAGVACSTGSACASGSTDPSPALVAMGCSAGMLSSALRFSWGVGTTAAEIDEAARRILLCGKELQTSGKGRKSSAAGRMPDAVSLQ